MTTLPNPDASRLPGVGAAQRQPVVAQSVRGLVLHFVVVLGVVTSVATTLGGPSAAISSALGVILAGLNLAAMRKIVRSLSEASGGSAAWALALPFKLVALVGVAFVLVKTDIAEPVPLAIGFALLPLTGIFLPRASSVPRGSASRAAILSSASPTASGQPLK